MIKEETYKKISNEFGCSVGLASTIHFIGLSSDEGKGLPKEFRGRVGDEIQINYIIEDSVWEGWYAELRRGILELESQPKVGRGRKPKEVTLYKRLRKKG